MTNNASRIRMICMLLKCTHVGGVYVYIPVTRPMPVVAVHTTYYDTHIPVTRPRPVMRSVLLNRRLGIRLLMLDAIHPTLTPMMVLALSRS